jgi:hypothetical protein
MEGSASPFCQSALERSGPEVESPVWRNRAHSASCMVVMVMISPSWQCNLSTLSLDDRGNVLRSMPAMTIFWLALAKSGP